MVVRYMNVVFLYFFFQFCMVISFGLIDVLFPVDNNYGSVALMQVYFQENYILAFIAAILHGTFAATIALTLSHDAR